MTNTSIIIAMGTTAVATAIIEKILVAIGKTDMAQFVNIGGLSLEGCQAVMLISKLIKACKTIG